MRFPTPEEFEKSNYKPTKKVLSHKGKEFNICHFQGRSFDGRPALVGYYFNKKIGGKLPDNVTIVTTETDEFSAVTCQQLQLNKIPYINSVDDIVLEWSNIAKVEFILKALKQVKTEFAIIVDARDVLFNTFDGILDKFLATGYRMIYNATKNNFPRMEIDKIHDRDWRGDFKYFNAGCCIGYTKDLVDFYEKCFEIKDSLVDLELINSEQYILRSVFAKYSEDVNQKYIDFDYDCDIFQSFAGTRLLPADSNTYIVDGYQPITTNDRSKK